MSDVKEKVIPTVETLVPVELLKKAEEALELCTTAEKLTINTQEEYDNASEFAMDIKEASKSLDDSRKEYGDPHRLKTKAINDHFNPVIKSLGNGETVIKKALGVFFQKKEAIRLAEERKLQAEADAREAKFQAQAEKELEKAETYREEGREDMAQKAEIRAETKFDQSFGVVADTVEDTTKKSGMSYVDTYEVTIVNMKKAIQALLESPSTDYLVTIDEPALKKALIATKGNMKIDGVTCSVKKVPRLTTSRR